MSLESNVADAIKRKGIGLAELSRKTGISYMKLYDSFSNANRARPLRGSELIAICEIIDVSPSYISEIERGTSICSLATIANISTVLQTSLDYLVFGITENNSSQTFTEVLKSVPEKKS